MPIYEFICEDCNYKEDLIRKISEPTIISCPKCNGQNFIKQVSAPNFKLKVRAGMRQILRIKMMQKIQRKMMRQKNQ